MSEDENKCYNVQGSLSLLFKVSYHQIPQYNNSGILSSTVTLLLLIFLLLLVIVLIHASCKKWIHIYINTIWKPNSFTSLDIYFCFTIVTLPDWNPTGLVLQGSVAFGLFSCATEPQSLKAKLRASGASKRLRNEYNPSRDKGSVCPEFGLPGKIFALFLVNNSPLDIYMIKTNDTWHDALTRIIIF